MSRENILEELIGKNLLQRLEFMELRGKEHFQDLSFCKLNIDQLNSKVYLNLDLYVELDKFRSNTEKKEEIDVKAEQKGNYKENVVIKEKEAFKFKGLLHKSKQIKKQLLEKSVTVIKKTYSTSKSFTQFGIKKEGIEDKIDNKLNLTLKSNKSYTNNNLLVKKKSDLNHTRDKSNETVKIMAKKNILKESTHKMSMIESNIDKKKLVGFKTHKNFKSSHIKNFSDFMINKDTYNNTLINKNLKNNYDSTNDIKLKREINSEKKEESVIIKKPSQDNNIKRKLESDFNDCSIDGKFTKISIPSLYKIQKNDKIDPLITNVETSPNLALLNDNLNNFPQIYLNFDKTYNLEHLNSCNQEDQEILNLNKEREYEVNKKTEKKNSYNYDYVLKESWNTLRIFLSKKEFITLKSTKKIYSHMINEYFIIFLQEEINMYNEKLNLLKEKNLDYLNQEIPEFIMGRSSSKAIELLDQDKYKNIFQNKTYSSKDILLPYKIYFTLINKTDLTSITDDQMFWNEICKFFNEDQIGNYISSSIKKFDFSLENVYKIYRISFNKDKKLSTSSFTKLCPTTGIMNFLIRETLEYIGIFINLKNQPTPSKFARLYNSIIEGNTKRIEKIKYFEKILHY